MLFSMGLEGLTYFLINNVGKKLTYGLKAISYGTTIKTLCGNLHEGDRSVFVPVAQYRRSVGYYPSS